ncbi:MAG TPA: SRPBCC domain-containing protein [Candidatus Saccharimonadales bacterium]|nr:SRPBCC domain-containing protein [Candidatus Saccharimonadales bacterium]
MSKTEFTVDKDKLEVRISKVFKATPERLWQAHTDPQQIVKWWNDTNVETFELKVGGRWRFVSEGWDGKEQAFRGEFKEIDEPNKLSRTFEYEPKAGHIMLETVTFEALPDGTTRQTTISKFDNLDDLNGMVSYGMEKGASEGLERLAKLVEQ